jgi:magnesium chelatase subunit I
LRNNTHKIKTGKPTFEGVHGFENTLIPELERYFIPHNINLLGFAVRPKPDWQMIELLDETCSVCNGFREQWWS